MAATLSRIRVTRTIFPSLNCLIYEARQSLLSRRCATANEETTEDKHFGEMFRNSQFVKLGRPAGKKVVGKVSHIVHREKNKDVYVDFGWKFHAVNSVPSKRDIKVGDKVEVIIKSLEATGHFLGQSKRITLNEAELTHFKKI